MVIQPSNHRENLHFTIISGIIYLIPIYSLMIWANKLKWQKIKKNSVLDLCLFYFTII